MEKKMLNRSMLFLIAGLFFGAFYREYTKFMGFTGTTKLSLLHPHLLVVGFVFTIIFLLLAKSYNVLENDKFIKNYNLYSIGVIITSACLFIRGMIDVAGVEISKAVDYSISGVAGIGHIILGISLFFVLNIIKKHTNEIKAI